MGINVGIAFANASVFADPEMAAALGELSEQYGVESLWTVEHVVIPADYKSTYPYDPSGKAPGAEKSDIPDPLIWLAYIAAKTKKVKLGTGILILPQRNPVVLAKEIATLDQLSSGRVQLGIGVGWLEEEFAAIGVPFGDRGKRTDEYVGAMRALWTQGQASFHGDYVNFDACISLPRPPQGSVPIVVGGHTPVSARRAGRLGDGFFPGKGTVEQLSELVTLMHSSASAAGRDGSKIELTTGAQGDPEVMKRLIDLGFTRFIVPPPAFKAEKLPAAFERLANTVIGPLSELG